MSNSIAEKLALLQETKAGIKQAIIDKGVQIDDADAFSLYPQKIADIPTGGGSTVGEHEILVVDYDGTIIDRQFLNAGDTYTLPDAPTHSRITFNSWSCPIDIVNGAITVPDYDVVIGPTYTVNSGKLEVDVDMNEVTGLTFVTQMSGTKDWGDGTIDTNTSHTYSNYGKYTIIFDSTTLAQYALCKVNAYVPQDNNCVVSVLLPNITLNTYGLSYLKGLQSVVLGYGITTIPAGFFNTSLFDCCIYPSSTTTLGTSGGGSSLPPSASIIVMPKTITYIGRSNSISNTKYYTLPKGLATTPTVWSMLNAYRLKSINFLSQATVSYIHAAYNLENVSIAEGVTSLPTSGNDFISNALNLKKVVFPSTITSIGSLAFQYCNNVIEYDFSKCTQIPTLNGTGGLGLGYGINPQCKIIVPASLYSQWIVANNWSSYAPYIDFVKEPIDVTVTTDLDNAQILGGI